MDGQTARRYGFSEAMLEVDRQNPGQVLIPAWRSARISIRHPLFERGLRIAPTNHLALFYLGNAYEAAGQPGRARTLYERVPVVAPQSAEAAQARERIAAINPHITVRARSMRVRGEADAVAARIDETGAFEAPRITPDLTGRPRIVSAVRSATEDRQV